MAGTAQSDTESPCAGAVKSGFSASSPNPMSALKVMDFRFMILPVFIITTD
jgi:hypothetical protein